MFETWKKCRECQTNELPPCGVREYVRSVVRALRGDTRLAWEKRPKGILYFHPSRRQHGGFIQQQIYELVKGSDAPMNQSVLRRAYKQRFRMKLRRPKQMGFKSLLSFVESIPTIEILPNEYGEVTFAVKDEVSRETTRVATPLPPHATSLPPAPTAYSEQDGAGRSVQDAPVISADGSGNICQEPHGSLATTEAVIDSAATAGFASLVSETKDLHKNTDSCQLTEIVADNLDKEEGAEKPATPVSFSFPVQPVLVLGTQTNCSNKTTLEDGNSHPRTEEDSLESKSSPNNLASENLMKFMESVRGFINTRIEKKKKEMVSPMEARDATQVSAPLTLASSSPEKTGVDQQGTTTDTTISSVDSSRISSTKEHGTGSANSLPTLTVPQAMNVMSSAMSLHSTSFKEVETQIKPENNLLNEETPTVPGDLDNEYPHQLSVSSCVATEPVLKDMLTKLRYEIFELVKLNNPIDASKLPLEYEKVFGRNLNFKQVGFKKLLHLVETVPNVTIVKNQYKKAAPAPPVVLVFKEQHGITQIRRVPSTSSSLDGQGCGRLDSTNDATDNVVSPQANAKMLSASDCGDVTGVPQGSTVIRFESPTSLAPSSSFKEVIREKYVELGEGPGFTTVTEDKDPSKKSSSTLELLQPCNIMMDNSMQRRNRAVIGDEHGVKSFEEMAFCGCQCIDTAADENAEEATSARGVYLNTHEPFCMVAIGTQGAGKSHTLSCTLESCLLNDAPSDVVRLKKPMTALVLHFDQSTTSLCEAAGLLQPCAALYSGHEPTITGNRAHVPRERAVILVSSTFYKQRKAFYGDYCEVRPLLFRWNTLTADHIKRIMGVTSSDNQLYMASFLTLLRRYQRKAVVPQFTEFLEEIREVCSNKSQSGPLDQRIALLESVIAESPVNSDIINESMDIHQAMVLAGMNLIIVDLTDPLLSKDDVNSLFQVVTEQFRSIPTETGKVLALDEAHKFMDGTVATDGLSEAIVNVARLMRHDGIRLVVSTQSPKALAPELLELVSIAVLHHFHSQDWWQYIRQKLPLPADAWDTILSLGPGHALVFASLVAAGKHHRQSMPVAIRRRLTADLGGSRKNTM